MVAPASGLDSGAGSVGVGWGGTPGAGAGGCTGRGQPLSPRHSSNRNRIRPAAADMVRVVSIAIPMDLLSPELALCQICSSIKARVAWPRESLTLSPLREQGSKLMQLKNDESRFGVVAQLFHW